MKYLIVLCSLFCFSCSTTNLALNTAYTKCERFCKRVGTSMDLQFNENVDFSCARGKK